MGFVLSYKGASVLCFWARSLFFRFFEVFFLFRPSRVIFLLILDLNLTFLRLISSFFFESEISESNFLVLVMFLFGRRYSIVHLILIETRFVYFIVFLPRRWWYLQLGTQCFFWGFCLLFFLRVLVFYLFERWSSSWDEHKDPLWEFSPHMSQPNCQSNDCSESWDWGLSPWASGLLSFWASGLLSFWT